MISHKLHLQRKGNEERPCEGRLCEGPLCTAPLCTAAWRQCTTQSWCGSQNLPSAQSHSQKQSQRASSLRPSTGPGESPAGSSPPPAPPAHPWERHPEVLVPAPSWGWSSLEVSCCSSLSLWKMALADAQVTWSLPRSAGPSGEQSLASHWHGTAPPSPGMFPSQSHSHLVNCLINILKGPLLAQAGVHPLLCLAASLLSLSSAMVRRMPFPRGREIHGLLPCSKGETATSYHETQTRAELSLRSGKAADVSPLPTLGHVHMAVALAQQKPLRKVPKVYTPTSASFGHVHEECTSGKTERHPHPFSNLDKEPIENGERAEALWGRALSVRAAAQVTSGSEHCSAPNSQKV